MYFQVADRCSPLPWCWHKDCSCSDNDSIMQVRKAKSKIYPIYHTTTPFPLALSVAFRHTFQAYGTDLSCSCRASCLLVPPKLGWWWDSRNDSHPPVPRSPAWLPSWLCTGADYRLLNLVAHQWWKEQQPCEWLGAESNVYALQESKKHTLRLRYLEVVHWFWHEHFLGWSLSVLSFHFSTCIVG